ncbi:hypothetical protein STEG23_005816, partial [Scotinomys teguina]
WIPHHLICDSDYSTENAPVDSYHASSSLLFFLQRCQAFSVNQQTFRNGGRDYSE